ncbi:hypothetical protein ACHAXS_007675, partial [Conticribra weissflogii]
MEFSWDPPTKSLHKSYKKSRTLGWMLKIKDQGSLSDYVGVNIHKQADGMYNFTQCTLINAIILDIGLKDKYTKPVPAKDSLHLHTFKSSPAFDDNFNYCSILEKLKYLAQTTRPNIMYATHQIANTYIVHVTLASSSSPIQRKDLIVSAMQTSWVIGMNCLPLQIQALQSCIADRLSSMQHALLWDSKLQSQEALFTTESEYIALSTSLCNVIPIMQLIEEFK